MPLLVIDPSFSNVVFSLRHKSCRADVLREKVQAILSELLGPDSKKD
jgi:hypothetical protein